MIERAARLIAIAAAVLGVILLIGAATTSHVQPDADAYWHAALRLRDGQALYGGPRGDETEIYRYAPWFAFAWVPLTYLGQGAAYLAWRAILVVATLVAVWPLLRRPSPASITLAVLLGGLLVSNLPAANVTPLIVGALVIGLRSRAGPVLLGMAASLKLFPLVLVAGFLAERRWRAAVVATVVTSVLWLTLLAFDLPLYLQIGSPTFYVGGVSLYAVSFFLWLPVAVAAGGVVIGLALSGSRWTWLAAAAAIPLAVPRVWLPDAAYLLVGLVVLPKVLAYRAKRRVQQTDLSVPVGT